MVNPAPSATEDPFQQVLARSDLLALRAGREADLRAQPTTSRGVATVERLLEAARALIVLGDVRDLTTIAIAAYANVNVATLYRYFRDVDAILREITLRREIDTAQMLATGLVGFAEAADWRSYSSSVVEAMAGYWEAGTDRGTIVHGMRAVAGVWPIVSAGHELNAELVALALHQRDASRTQEAWLTVARPLVVSVREGLSYSNRGDLPDRDYAEQLKVLASAYLGCYLDG